ncbi:MAG: helix-turn-helix domain-containing protein [Bacteroides sp.]|nr:helix-turn-helix domain-containing protein [Bacteroides sp.]
MKQAASDLGMTEQSLHKIIKGNSTKIDTLIAISKYFKVEPAYFFDSGANEEMDYINVSKEKLFGLIKKVLAYSIHGFGMIKLEWDNQNKTFNSYFDVLNKQYNPDESDLEYISSLLETKINITDKTAPKDLTKLLMSKDEFEFTSSYYYGIRKMQTQEELHKIISFLDKHKIPVSDSIKQDMEDLKQQIRYYESKSIIGANK